MIDRNFSFQVSGGPNSNYPVFSDLKSFIKYLLANNVFRNTRLLAYGPAPVPVAGGGMSMRKVASRQAPSFFTLIDDDYLEEAVRGLGSNGPNKVMDYVYPGISFELVRWCRIFPECRQHARDTRVKSAATASKWIITMLNEQEIEPDEMIQLGLLPKEFDTFNKWQQNFMKRVSRPYASAIIEAQQRWGLFVAMLSVVEGERRNDCKAIIKGFMEINAKNIKAPYNAFTVTQAPFPKWAQAYALKHYIRCVAKLRDRSIEAIIKECTEHKLRTDPTKSIADCNIFGRYMFPQELVDKHRNLRRLVMERKLRRD